MAAETGAPIAVLREVFSFHILDRVVHADGRLHPDELSWMRARFDPHQLHANGLMDAEHRLTPRFRDLLAEALSRLPRELDTLEKAALLDAFYDGAHADGQLRRVEERAIRAASQLLGVPLEITLRR